MKSLLWLTLALSILSPTLSSSPLVNPLILRGGTSSAASSPPFPPTPNPKRRKKSKRKPLTSSIISEKLDAPAKSKPSKPSKPSPKTLLSTSLSSTPASVILAAGLPALSSYATALPIGIPGHGPSYAYAQLLAVPKSRQIVASYLTLPHLLPPLFSLITLTTFYTHPTHPLLLLAPLSRYYLSLLPLLSHLASPSTLGHTPFATLKATLITLTSTPAALHATYCFLLALCRHLQITPTANPFLLRHLPTLAFEATNIATTLVDISLIVAATQKRAVTTAQLAQLNDRLLHFFTPLTLYLHLTTTLASFSFLTTLLYSLATSGMHMQQIKGRVFVCVLAVNLVSKCYWQLMQEIEGGFNKT